MSYLTHYTPITFAPVQRFIERSRKLRDLLQKLKALDHTPRFITLGQIKTGKSTMLNALLGLQNDTLKALEEYTPAHPIKLFDTPRMGKTKTAIVLANALLARQKLDGLAEIAKEWANVMIQNTKKYNTNSSQKLQTEFSIEDSSHKKYLIHHHENSTYSLMSLAISICHHIQPKLSFARLPKLQILELPESFSFVDSPGEASRLDNIITSKGIENADDTTLLLRPPLNLERADSKRLLKRVPPYVSLKDSTQLDKRIFIVFNARDRTIVDNAENREKLPREKNYLEKKLINIDFQAERAKIRMAISA